MEFKEHYHEVLAVIGNMFIYIFKNLNKQYAAELAAVNAQYPFEPLKFDDKLLGRLVLDKYNTGFYCVDKYPLAARPFYTMPDPYNPSVSNSYDFFLRGEEITSGAQRIHNTELLVEQANKHEIP